MKKILFITTLSVAILSAGLKVPVAFKTNFKQKITNSNGKVITYNLGAALYIWKVFLFARVAVILLTREDLLFIRSY